MKKNILLYALSTALNRGSVLLFFPLLTQVLSLSEFGVWNLTIIVSNLLIPLISLNGIASILREGSSHLGNGYYLMRRFIWLTLVVGGISSTLLLLLHAKTWVLYAVLISTGESLLFLGLTYIRARENAFLYFIINFFKVLTLLVMLFIANKVSWTFDQIMQWHIGIVAICALIILFIELIRGRKLLNDASLDWRACLFFCIALIPHSLFQWVMSSSDRLIIKYLYNDASVGTYSLAYNLALFLMLINSGLALALPSYLIKNYEHWLEKDLDNKLIKAYSVVSVFLFFLILLGYYIDRHYFQVLKYYNVEILVMVTLIYLGIYFLGLYYFYSNHLFYYKKSRTISIITIKVAIMSFIFAFLGTYFLGLIGTALATLLSYVVYVYLVRKESLKLKSSINIKLTQPAVFVVSTISIISIFMGRIIVS